MKISELIQYLQSQLEKHGDVPVYVSRCCANEDLELSDDSYSEFYVVGIDDHVWGILL